MQEGLINSQNLLNIVISVVTCGQIHRYCCNIYVKIILTEKLRFPEIISWHVISEFREIVLNIYRKISESNYNHLGFVYFCLLLYGRLLLLAVTYLVCALCDDGTCCLFVKKT